jgi:putative DNA primase/helicase
MDKASDANDILCRNGEHALREHHDRHRLTFNGHSEHRSQARSPGTANSCISRCMADVAPEHVRWLWKRRLALGKTNLFAGNPGNGKSQVTVSIAATTSTGGLWPDGTQAPIGSVIFISCEDDVADTIVPRLHAAGADLNRVHVLDWVRKPTSNGEQDQDRLFSLAEDVPALEALVRKIGDVSLIVIDPVSAYVGSIDSHKASDVRGALAPLQTLAARTGAAVVLVAHLNKGAGDGSAMARVGGSGAFVAACRSAWLVEVDPQDEDRKRRILAPLKNNIGDDTTGFAFSIQSMEVAGGIETSRVVFEPGSVTVSASELLRGQQQTDDDRGALDEAVEFLREFLRDGAKTSKSVEKAAREAGIAARTIERARAKLKIKARKSDVTGAWLIALPDSEHRQGRQDRQPPDAGADGGVGQC